MSQPNKCPKCGFDSVFIPDLASICVVLGKKRNILLTHFPNSSRRGAVIAYCNNTQCDQRYWFFERTKRVQLRHAGPTYKEYREQRS